MTKKIVIVEDDQDILDIMQIILGNDYKLHLYDTPPNDFLDQISHINPDLVILDWIVPKHNMEVFIDPIKNKLPNCKILIISAQMNLHKAFEGKNVDGVIPKPFGVKVLKEKITNALESTVSSGKIQH